MAGSSTAPGGPERPLRADAERNRQLILDAAKQAFAEQGLGVRLDEIAAVAGVGVATVYRRFKDKDALVSALFEQQIAGVVALADEALATCEDGTGLRWFLEHAADLMARDRGLQQLLTGSPTTAEVLSAVARTEIQPRAIELLRRAAAAGRVRPDLVAGDLPVVQILTSTIIDATANGRPELRHRYAQMLFDALEPRPQDTALHGPAPTVEEGIQLIETWQPPPRRPGARG